MSWKASTMALLVFGSLASVAVPVAADENGCEVTTVGGTCTFHCHAGDYISVNVWGTLGNTWGQATCGGQTAACSTLLTYCGAESYPGTTSEDNAGVCKLNAGTRASCVNTRLQEP